MPYELVDVQDVLSELPAYGYEPTDKDRIMARAALDRATSRIKSFTNLPKLPKKIRPELIKMAVGEFLYYKKITGGLTGENADVNFPLLYTQFTEGDTSVSITPSGKNDESNFDEFLNYLRMGDPYVLEHFRVLDWR